MTSENRVCSTVSYTTAQLAEARNAFSHNDCSADISATTPCAVCNDPKQVTTNGASNPIE